MNKRILPRAELLNQGNNIVKRTTLPFAKNKSVAVWLNADAVLLKRWPELLNGIAITLERNSCYPLNPVFAGNGLQHRQAGTQADGGIQHAGVHPPAAGAVMLLYKLLHGLVKQFHVT